MAAGQADADHSAAANALRAAGKEIDGGALRLHTLKFASS